MKLLAVLKLQHNLFHRVGDMFLIVDDFDVFDSKDKPADPTYLVLF